MKAHELNSQQRYALPEEIDWFSGLNIPEPIVAVMIGAGPGVLGLALKEQAPDKLIDFTIIDISTTKYAIHYLNEAGYTAKSFVGDSYGVGRIFWSEPIDILIVDGDHSYEGVSRDIEAWLPHMKPDGLIFFHDYLERENGFSGTDEWALSGGGRAINEAAADGKLVLIETIGISIICGVL